MYELSVTYYHFTFPSLPIMEIESTPTTKEDMLQLVSSDGVHFQVPYSIMKLSDLIKGMIGEENDEEGSSDDEDEEEATEHIPLPNISSQLLTDIIKFCTMYHNNPFSTIPKPLTPMYFEKDCPKKYATFISCPLEKLFAIIVGANYMDINPLLEISCAKVASQIKGRTPEEIRALFGLTTEMTEEEEASILRENPWLNKYN